MGRWSVDITLESRETTEYQPLITNLISYYAEFDYCQVLGMEPIEYLCQLAVRYAYATYGKVDSNLLTFSRWLSLVWIVDGALDSAGGKNLNLIADLTATFQGKSADSTDPLVVLTKATYQFYLTEIEPLRVLYPHPADQIVFWLDRYLNTLSHEDYPDDSLLEYTKWRLDGGAMMCVVWHLILFSQGAECDDGVAKLTAIVVSFHNDLVSYHRDQRQGVPNLIDMLEAEDDFKAFHEAIDFVNEIYDLIEDCNPPQLIIDIIEGSHSWTCNEPRYQIGVAMIDACLDEDRQTFYRLLGNSEVTPGDGSN